MTHKAVTVLSIRESLTEELLKKRGFHVLSCDSLKVDKTNFDSWFCALISVAKRVKPQAFYFFKDTHLPSKFFYDLKNAFPHMKFIMRYWDQRGSIPECIQTRSGLIDTLLMNNRDPRQIKMYKKFGITNIRTLYNTVIGNGFTPLDIYRPYNVFFGGSHYEKRFPLSSFRYKLIHRIRSKHKLVVYGTRWDFPTCGIKRRDEYYDALQTAHINLGINHYSIKNYYSERTIQNPASGRMHITHYIPNMERDFENHKNIVWFKTIEECLDLISFYMKNEEKREKIANVGREHIIAKFGMDRFIDVFSNAIMQTIDNTKEIIDY